MVVTVSQSTKFALLMMFLTQMYSKVKENLSALNQNEYLIRKISKNFICSCLLILILKRATEREPTSFLDVLQLEFARFCSCTMV